MLEMVHTATSLRKKLERLTFIPKVLECKGEIAKMSQNRKIIEYIFNNRRVLLQNTSNDKLTSRLQ
jgi:hypothetical protein